MTETKCYCDHCGKELNTKIDYDNLTLDMYLESRDADLCVGRYNELLKYIRQFCTKAEKERES
jgi:hypothetical protein